MAQQIDERPHVCLCHSPYLLHMASTINCMNRCPSACPPLWVAPGMTLADLQRYIDFTRFGMYSTCMDAQRVRHDSRRFACIYRICMHDTDTRIRCNRHLRGLNRCRSAHPILWATSTLADFSAYCDSTCFEMYVHGC